ncbi:MAG: ABC transporter ATP-binding protein, partial [Planctomycetes bacterium]|nr:ABC transporter ATP-binding protein [Planctomycetota bacterium]
MSGQIAYHLEEVQKMLGDFVLRIHQLDIKQGESFCVLGPTGSGKTTLLRILSGLEPPTEGDVCFGDRPVQNGELDLMNRRRIAMVFQRPLLLRGSVRKNVEFPLRLRGQLHQRSEYVDAILEQLRLTPLVSQSA